MVEDGGIGEAAHIEEPAEYGVDAREGAHAVAGAAGHDDDLAVGGAAQGGVGQRVEPEHEAHSGDNILGRSSSSVRNLKQYLASLELMARQNPAIICPGHGPTIYDGAARIRWYLQHRQEREKQILDALSNGAATVDETVAAVYPRNLRKNLRPAAARNVSTHLAKLQAEGRVAEQPARYAIAE